MKLKIAVAQLKIDLKNAEENFRKVEKYLKRARGKADIIVFPEYLISWNFIDRKGLFRKRFQELAKKYKIDIVTGTMLAKYKKKTYNTAYYIDRTGKVRGTYRKVNLWRPERPFVAFGNELCVFNTKFGKVGLVICWDLAFPELYRAMVKKGATIVICPAFWSSQDASAAGLNHNPKAEEVFVDACCLSRTCENEIVHVFCNAAGKVAEGKSRWTLIGCSQISVPFKGVIKKLNRGNEGMFIQEIDTSILKDAERAYKIRKDLKSRIL